MVGGGGWLEELPGMDKYLVVTIGSCSIAQFRGQWRQQPWPQLTNRAEQQQDEERGRKGQDRRPRIFLGRQFVYSSRNLLAKLHDHKLCSPNLFTRQRGRWRFNYSVEAVSVRVRLHVCVYVCVLGEIPGRLPRFLSTQQHYATTELESEKSSLPLRFFGSEREKISRDFGNLPSWQAPIPIVALWSKSPPPPAHYVSLTKPDEGWEVQKTWRIWCSYISWVGCVHPSVTILKTYIIEWMLNIYLTWKLENKKLQ